MPADRFSKQAEVPTSFEEERTMLPPPRMSESPIPFDPGNNFFGQGGFAEESSQDYLPSFHRFGEQGRFPPSHVPDRSPTPRTWKNALKGWKVIFGSFCILALIPLVRLHDLSTRDLASRIGGSRAGLLNCSMISALRKCELRVVQSTLVGSMLSKLLLVLGLCFFAGGMRFSEQGFDTAATHIHSSLLSLSVGAVLLPAAYHFTLGSDPSTSSEVQKQNILHMSHGVSIVLLFIYFAYLLFQLWSHTHLYNDQHNKKSSLLSAALREKRTNRRFKYEDIPLTRTTSQPDFAKLDSSSHLAPPFRPFASSVSNTSSDVTLKNRAESFSEKGPYFPRGAPTIHSAYEMGAIPMSRNTTLTDSISSSGPPLSRGETYQYALDDRTITSSKAPQLSWFLTIFLLIVVTGTVAVTVDWLVEAMDEISMTISKEWIGLIILPTISAVAECITAVKVSVRDELTLSISVAVGSTIQTALFVIPFTVILAWITNKPLSLLMDPFQSMVLYIAVHTMGYVVADGKSNWLEGVILICLYVITAVSFWFYPGSVLELAECVPSN
ncbi:hypothetical protein M413DRAFT_19589 [Hebeloma cylindrosporum]|uniref:Sodium/calcium exchanger membrane region domain-containing protein n=1 Tax=Hebeloma cylindrosporum TaxID=76867 RepID=A0A0C3C6D5_HEBCY|nr:hypothetical protein M413DRAFT_19589 [Hebeloma cylindrosporum h7]